MMKTKAFSLLETLISIILLSIIISNFSNFFTQTSNFSNHNKLQKLQNDIYGKTYNAFSKTKVDIDFNIQKNSTIKYIQGNKYIKYQYKNKQKLSYIHIPQKLPNLKYREFE